MPNISISLSDKQLEALEYLIEKKNYFLACHDIPLEVTRTSVIGDLIVKEAQRVRDINNDNSAS